MNLKYILAAFFFGFPAAFAGGFVGNGGDAVFCKDIGNGFSGYYSLDYLVEYDKALLPNDVKDLEESLDRIESTLSKKLPELLPSFKEYRKDLFNETDFTQRHIWKKAAFGLVDLKDESIVDLLPTNCTESKKINIVQAVIRKPPESMGLPETKVYYKYVQSVVDDLRKQGPLQLSFLLIHEWLWDFSKSVERNRTINYWLHSSYLDNWTRNDWIRNLKGVGFTIPQMQPPVWENAICVSDPANISSIYLPHKHFIHGQGQIFMRRTTCDKIKGCTQSYADFSESVQNSYKPPFTLTSASSKNSSVMWIYDQKGDPENTSYWKMMCGIYEDGSTDIACEFDWFGPAVPMTPTIGRDCVTFRGRIVEDKGSFNQVDEYVLYFPNVGFP